MARNNFNQWTLAVLRIVLGLIFSVHGYAKLFVKGGLPGTVVFFSSLGIPLPNYAAVLVAFVEFFGGILLIIGLLSRWTSAIIIIEMLVALFKVHLKQGFFGYEFVLLILAGLLAIVVNGPGKLSVGKMISKKKHLQ